MKFAQIVIAATATAMLATDDFTPSELASYLSSSTLPTLIAEGRSDSKLFRCIEKDLSLGAVLPAGGKNTVLGTLSLVNNRPRKFARAFLVDSDTWTLDGIPFEWLADPLLIATSGYSIENDLLSDLTVESLLYDDQQASYRYSLESVIKWFSAGLAARQSGVEFILDRKLNTILTVKGDLTVTAEREVAVYRDTLIEQYIRDDYTMRLRGKTWLALLMRYLDAPERPIRHSAMALLETSWLRPSKNIVRLKQSINTAMNV